MGVYKYLFRNLVQICYHSYDFCIFVPKPKVEVNP